MYKRIMFSIFWILIFGLISTSLIFAQNDGDFRTAQSGAWANKTTWQQYNSTSGTWIAASTIPNYNDGHAVTIMSGDTITFDGVAVNDTLQYANYIKQTTIETGAVLEITNSSCYIHDDGVYPNLTINGTLIIDSGAQLKFHNGTEMILIGDGGVLDNSAGDWNHGIVPTSTSQAGYIEMAGTGTLETGLRTADNTVPIMIGTESAYAPVTISPASHAILSLNVDTSTVGSNGGADRVQLDWTITSDQDYTPIFQWPSSAEGANFSSNRSTDANLFSGSNAVAATLGGSDPYTLTATSAQTAGTAVYKIGKDEFALPVELTTFSAKTVETGIELSWQTATEINNYGFEIERKSGNSSWEKIGFVKGAGNSSSTKDYSFLDKVSSGKYTYRLKQIDDNGTYKYSGEIEATANVPSAFKLNQNYPNPFNPSTSIKFNLPKASFVNLTIYNVLGAQVATLVNEKLEPGTYTKNFNANNLSSGVYFYRLTAGNIVITKKMSLLK